MEFAFSGRPCVTLSACTILLNPYNSPVRQLILPPFYRLRNWEIRSLVQCHTAGSEVIRAEGLYSMGPELFCWPPGNNEWVANELHMSVAHLCGLQCGTWEVEPSHHGNFGHEDQPRALMVFSGLIWKHLGSETDLLGWCLLMMWEKNHLLN